MDHHISSNGHHPDAGSHEPVNAYADALLGSQPREIVDFELGTDPYANVIPIASRRPARSVVEDERWDGEESRRNPLVVAVSVLLVVLLVLVPLAVVLARLGV